MVKKTKSPKKSKAKNVEAKEEVKVEKVVKETPKVETPKATPKVETPIVNTREELKKKILADPRMPGNKEFLAGGNDVLRRYSEIEAEYGVEMIKNNLGMTSLMKAKDELKG
jgi:hypothetical protein